METHQEVGLVGKNHTSSGGFRRWEMDNSLLPQQHEAPSIASGKLSAQR